MLIDLPYRKRRRDPEAPRERFHALETIDIAP